MSPDTVVIRYHEIALKHANRGRFVHRLVKNVANALRGTQVRRVAHGPARLLVDLAPDADWPEIRRRLARVFGIANFLPAYRCEPSLEALRTNILRTLGGRPIDSFAIRTKRADKTFPVESPEVSRVLGQALRESSGGRVDLDHPALEVHVEITPGEAFFAFDRFPGPGGLPVGSGGTVLTLLSGGIDSPVAAWRILRRGCESHFVHFHGTPFQSRRSLEKATELAEILSRWQSRCELNLVPFGLIQREIVNLVPERFRVLIYRRMMVRIAEAIAARLGASALVTGESLGQVASQTLPNLAVVEAAATIPILRPLIGMDKTEITAQAQKIGTYETSIQPDEDCCQLFVPRHPATRMTLEEAARCETALPVAEMVESALGSIEAVSFSFPPRTATVASLEEPSQPRGRT